MKSENTKRFLDELDSLFPDAHCELKHSNPLELLVAVILSAQTTDASVNKVTPLLFKKYHIAQDYANASLEDLEVAIHKIGLYRNKARSIKKMAQRLVDEFDGEVPEDMDQLISLPGVGIKTANVVRAVAFNYPSIAVDTHVARIAKRLGYADRDDPVMIIEENLEKAFPKERWIKLHHQLIFFGRYHCKAKRPECKKCHLVDICLEENKNL